MKNLARIIAIAIAMSAVFFIGCSNDVGGTLGNNTLLAVLLQQKSNGNITELKLNAISDDHTVSFGSRTILPDALDASEMTFYYWGTDTINASSNTSINTPTIVAFNGSGDGFSGTVSVNLSVSAYKLKLAGCLNTDLPASTSVSDVMAKAVVFGVADVDLRYTQEINFYLNPNSIDGTGTVDIRFRTKNAWKNDKYSVTVRIENKGTGETVTGTDQAWYAIGDDWADPADNVTGTVNDGLATTTGVEYKIASIPNGSYNLVVDYYNGTMHSYWSDTLIVLAGQVSNMHSTKVEFETGVYGIELTNDIELPPAPPANLRVGYLDADNRDSQKFLATFEWDDKSMNEQYFLFELLDVTECNTGTITTATNKTGYDDDTQAALASIMANYPNDTATDDLVDKDGATVLVGSWPVLAAHAKTVRYQFRETIYQDFETLYAAGSLNKNSTSLSLWLDLGHSYVARVTSINRASGSQAADCDATKTAGKTSASKWIYTNTAALTTTDPRPVVASITNAGLSGTSYSTAKWSVAPLAVNRYRLEYILNGGSFYKVDKWGTPLTWDESTGSSPKVTDISKLSSETLASYLTYYDSITDAGKAIVDPTIWANNDTTRAEDLDTTYSGSTAADYVTLYRGILSFKGWFKDEVKTENLYSMINWSNAAGTTFTGASTDTYVATDYGIINGEHGEVGAATPATDSTAASATDSTDGLLYTNKLMSTPLYFEGGNLTLVANFGSDAGGVEIDDPYNYNLYSQNIRLYKIKGTADPSYPGTEFSTSGSQSTGVYVDSTTYGKTAVCDYPGVQYDDGEVSTGTFKLSGYYEKLSVLVVENQLTSTDKDNYKKVSVEVIDAKGNSILTRDGKKTTYIISDSTKGSSTEAISKTNVGTAGSAGSDPLLKYENSGDNEHNAYYVVINTTDFTPGNKYTIIVKAITDELKDSGYEKNLTVEFTDPEYDMTDDANFTEVASYTATTEGEYYIKNDSTYRRSAYNTPNEAKIVGGFDGSAADKKLYTLTGTPNY